MGQTLRVLSDGLIMKLNDHDDHELREDGTEQHYIPDLAEWPPELSLNVLKNLDATDLCLAACVWTELAKDELLWQSLCYSQWPYISLYLKPKRVKQNYSYHKLYLILDESSVTFNADYKLGMEYFFKYGLVEDDPIEIAKFFHYAKPLDRTQMRYYLKSRPDILDIMVGLQDFRNEKLSGALRKFFNILEAPNNYDHYLHLMVEKFSQRFIQCNPDLDHTPETIYVLCFSLIMLSVDLWNPHIKNKMSKREFIRNVRRAIRVMDDELYGHLYDDIYLRGHIASSLSSKHHNHHNQHNHHQHNSSNHYNQP